MNKILDRRISELTAAMRPASDEGPRDADPAAAYWDAVEEFFPEARRVNAGSQAWIDYLDTADPATGIPMRDALAGASPRVLAAHMSRATRQPAAGGAPNAAQPATNTTSVVGALLVAGGGPSARGPGDMRGDARYPRSLVRAWYAAERKGALRISAAEAREMGEKLIAADREGRIYNDER
jgi:hypothetical protein